jgi:hypothetical protein
MSGFGAPSQILSDQWSRLQQQWTQCRDEWNDDVARRFEREFWEAWQGLLPSAVAMFQAMEEAIEQAERETDVD